MEVIPNQSQTLNNLGRAYWIKKDSVTARNYFQRALNFNKRFFKAHYNLAVMEKNLHRYSQAEKSFVACGRLRPGELHAKYHLVDVYEVWGRLTKGLKVCNYFITSHPSDAKLRLLRARLLMKLGSTKTLGLTTNGAPASEIVDTKIKM